MRYLSLVLIVCSAACAETPGRVRSVEGFPLSTTAQLDADGPPIKLHCHADGPSYLIVARWQDYAVGRHFATETPFVHDAAALCARIQRD